MPERKGKDAFYCSGCKKTLPKQFFGKKSKDKRGKKSYLYPDGSPKYVSRCFKCSSLAAKYGITGYQHEIMRVKQGGKCLICEKTETIYKRGQILALSVDHCHKTNKIRGLLCRKCNMGLGLFNESPTLLRKVANYIIETAKKETA